MKLYTFHLFCKSPILITHAVIIRNSETLFDVYHPVDVFNLLKRSFILSKDIDKNDIHYSFAYNNTWLYEDFKRAHHGLADIHEYFNLNLTLLAQGKIMGKCPLI